jgi:hypothetical protein
MVAGFSTTYAIDESLITTKVVSESRSGEMYLIQHYVIKFVSELRQVGGFLWALRFPPTKMTATI